MKNVEVGRFLICSVQWRLGNAARCHGSSTARPRLSQLVLSMVFDFNTVGNVKGIIYELWRWALATVHRFAIVDCLFKAIGLRLVSSHSEPRRKPRGWTQTPRYPTASPGKRASNERSIAGAKPTSHYQSAQTSQNPVSGQPSGWLPHSDSEVSIVVRRRHRNHGR